MGTTTSQPDPYARDSSGDVLPAQVQPNYRPNLPPQVGGPTTTAQNLPPELQPTGQPPNQPNYTVTGTGPGTWWRQQQQQQPPIPQQFRPPQQPVPLQPTDPNFRYQPPQNSEQPPVRNMPPLWGGNQVGASGQTKQQFLLGRMAHESQGDPTALNYMARNDPRMYHPGVDASGRQHPGYSASGILQDTNETWASGVKWAMADPDRYPMHGDDPSKYPVAGYAPWNTQWQVNSAIYDHMGETPWRERSGVVGAGFKGRLADGFYNSMAEPTQQYAPAQPRSFAEWGRAPQGMGGSRPGEMPRHTDFGRIMGAVAPLLVGIASLAMRMPLSTAITAYGAMARAQQNGQQLDYERSRTRFQDQLKEATAQQALESRDASDAFSEYGNNNPQGLQQQLASIALKYNDPIMFRMAQQGDLNGIHQLQARRDTYGQDLTKLERANQEHQDRQAQDAAVAAMDRKYQQEHPDATPDDLAIAHNEHIGQAAQAGTKTGSGAKPEQEGEVHDVLDKDGNRVRQVREGKTGGLFDLNGNPTTIDEKNGETLAPQSSRSAGGRDPTEGDYTWTNPDGSQGEGYAKVKGKQLVDAVTEEPIPTKPGTRVNKISAQSAAQAGNAARGATGPIQDWEGMNEGQPPPGVSQADWAQAQDWARLGRAPPGLSSRSGAYQGAHDALPYALHAIGKTGASMPRDAIDYETQRTASTSTERYFTSGMGARQLTSLDTVAAHIGLFREYGAAVKSGDIQLINRAAGNLATATGSPELIDMGIAATITGDEVIRLLTQTGGSRGDREDIKDKLSVYSSPEQFEGIANTLTNFVRERYDPLRQQYTNRIGATEADKARYEEAFKNKITPAARAIIEQKQPIAGGVQVQPMTEQQYNDAPSGTQYRMPDDPPGKVRVKP